MIITIITADFPEHLREKRGFCISPEELAKLATDDVSSTLLLDLANEFIKSIPAESLIDSLLEELRGKKSNKLKEESINKPPKADTESNTPKDLKDTIEGMQSADYRERFKAEYFQTKIRYDNLCAMLIKAKKGTLEFEPTCPLALLKAQSIAMENYIACLVLRAEMEGIELK